MRRVGTHPQAGRLRLHAADERGATMAEYSVMLGLLVLVAFIAVQMFGISVQGLFQALIDRL
jgi:Flp pilus assembly pilin Flp